MKLDLSLEAVLQIRAVLIAAAAAGECPHDWLADWWPAPDRCDVLVDHIDRVWAGYGTSLEVSGSVEAGK
jgi:hypothetical protein